MDAAITSWPDGAVGYIESKSWNGATNTSKNELQPWKQDCCDSSWTKCRVCQMESVLQVYQQRYHPDFPVICLWWTTKNNSSKKLLSQLSQKPRQPKRHSTNAMVQPIYSYYVNRWQDGDIWGLQNVTAVDYAHLLKDLGYLLPDALITVVQDNLNIHCPASLYKAFEPAEARRILDRLEFCHKAWYTIWQR